MNTKALLHTRIAGQMVFMVMSGFLIQWSLEESKWAIQPDVSKHHYIITSFQTILLFASC